MFQWKNSLMEKFSQFMAKNGYKNRSKAISYLIRNALLGEEWENKNSYPCIWPWSSRPFRKIDTYPACFLKEILFSSHLHLNEQNCMEIIAVHGTVSRISQFKKNFINYKRVRFVKVVFVSTGKLEV